MQNHLSVEANIQVTVNSHNVKEYRVSQKNSALALLQQQANALFLLGHPVCSFYLHLITLKLDSAKNSGFRLC